MIESAGKPQAFKSRTEKAKVRKNRAERIDTSRTASVKNGSSREDAGVKADDTMKVNSGAKIGTGAEAQTGARANVAVRSETVPADSAADPTNYVSRELSWLEFNYRVFSESRDKSVPLFERLKFLNITASNLDELYMVRVVSLKDMVYTKHTKLDVADLTPQKQLDRISERTHELVEMQYSIYNRSLVSTLRQNGLRVITEYEDMTEEKAACTDEYLRKNAYPVLTPMAFDPSGPFPLIRNKMPNIAVFLRKKSEEDEELEFVMVWVPSVISRIVELPREIDEGGKECRVVILLEEIIERNIPSLFLNYNVTTPYPFRIVRNADLTINGEEAVGLLEETQKQLKERQWGEVIRLETEDNMGERLLEVIRRELSINSQDIFEISGPLDLMFLMKMYGLGGFELFKTPRYVPQPVPALMNEDGIFTNIREGDILFHHPYQGFDPVVNFVRSAAQDQSVLVVKQTLYHVSGNSPIVAALVGAADNEKQVSILVGLKARFDEENNINWAKILEKTGYYVIYGLVDLKTHDKITLVVRMEEGEICRYIHLDTGNYSDSTTRLYADCDIFTCNSQIEEDTTAVFNMLSGYFEPLAWNRLSMVPLWLRGRFLCMMRREAEHVREGRPAHTMAKINSLCGKETITTLYGASCAGVKVGMIIKGTCCLKASVSGLSEDISVRPIMGNFLEHSRIFYFSNDVSPEVYMGSADWIPRNLDHRVGITLPVGDEVLREEVVHILGVELEDNVKAYILQPDGSCEEEGKRGKVLVNSQEQFCREAILMAKESIDQENLARSRVFRSIISSDQECSRKKHSRKDIQNRIV